MINLKEIRKKAAQSPKKIILPEGDEQRIIKAAKIIKKDRIAELIILKKSEVRPDLNKFATEYYHLRKHKGMSPEEAKATFLKQPVYYAAMMVRQGLADGFVAGASHTTRDVARAALHCIGIDKRIGILSSAFLMIMPDKKFGQDGVFLFADCGIVPEPSASQLASIAIASADLLKRLFDFKPRIAMLSYSTKGSGSGKGVDKVREATEIVRSQEPDLIIDGEMQVDAAIVPEVANIKAPDSPLKGRANLLIFPDLESGNIAYKLVQRLAGAKAIGPLLLGLNKPASDLSRGCSAEDIVDAVAITCLRAQ